MLHFSEGQFSEIKERYEKWWNRKSDEIIVGGIVKKHAPSEPEPKKPMLSQWNVHEHFTADEVVDAIAYELSQYEFIGDAFPYFNMDCFGPGVVAAFLGCELSNDNGKNSVWFHPTKKYDIHSFKPEYDPDNFYLKWIKQIYKKAVERFEGKALFGMPDLGGIADILSSFFPGEELLYLLYDEPEKTLETLLRIDDLWHKFFREFAQDMQAEKYGYTDWSGMYSTGSSYVLQSDFSYMISNDMFEEFVMPTMRRDCKDLRHTLYHLDGVGELKHLDSLLSIEELDAIQWVPGAGHPEHVHWPQIYRQITDKNKLCQIFWAGYENLYKIASDLGRPGYLQHNSRVFTAEEEPYVREWVSKLKKMR